MRGRMGGKKSLDSINEQRGVAVLGCFAVANCRDTGADLASEATNGSYRNNYRDSCPVVARFSLCRAELLGPHPLR